jgi:uncharacterized damage-inducible protein DinB
LDKWRHLFVDGEFIERDRALAGLSAEQAARKPSEHSHSIYEELWHANRWQNIVVLRDKELYAEWQRGHVYPDAPPANEEEWQALVAEFLGGLEKALEWTRSPEKLAHETSPGMTMADVLRSLAIHTSYHVGKIVALRQFIGAWPPPEQS